MSTAEEVNALSLFNDPRSREIIENLLKLRVLPFFEKLGVLLKPEEAAFLCRAQRATFYDWNHKEVFPPGTVITLNQRPLVRLNMLEKWIISQNPEIRFEEDSWPSKK